MKFREFCLMTVWGSAAILTLSNLGCNDEGTTPSGNRPPEATAEIPAQVLATGTSAILDLSPYFTDPDGDSLTYSATVSDDLVATVSVFGNSLRVVGLALGTADVTVTATDAGGLSTTQAFDLVVRTQPSVDRPILVALYEWTEGEDWTTSTGWMSHAPIGEWFGIETDGEGLVTGLDLRDNGLVGQIPSAIGGLSHLTSLDLSFNSLEGSIPAELFRLSSLARLDLSGTALEGTFPSGLARLSNLTELHLLGTGLWGPIPPELGRLANLEVLNLSWTNLSDTIPPEFGDLSNLRILNLRSAGIQGRIPAELGNLASLEELILADNHHARLYRVPPELGSLSNLINLDLANMGLIGSIPVEIGDLAELETLALQGNWLRNSVPGELGRLAKLRRLYLSGNSLEGSLSPALTALRSLEELVASSTELCAPTDTLFTRWLEGIPKRRVRPCGSRNERAYLVQAVQSRSYPVPLVAGEDALLRVFPTADSHTGDPLPPVRATFYPASGGEGHVVDLPAGSAEIPQEVEEGRLDFSVNAWIPGSVVQPGMEMVVDIDPDQTLDPTLGVTKRVPEEGRLEIEVLEMPTLDVTVVPFLWQPNPDSAILDLTNGMTGDDTLFWDTRTLLPVADMKVTVHDPVVTEDNDALYLVRLTEMIRKSEGGSGHYLGTMSGEVVGARGYARLGGRIAFSIPDVGVIGHEFGHNLNLRHAPGCGAGGPDAAYPHANGSTGAWGLDPRTDTLIDKTTPDFMSYCNPPWVSDYHFTNAARYRLSDDTGNIPSPQQRVLFLWGGVDAEGTPHLDPAFVLDAPASLPRADGPNRITGRTTDGTELFSLRFEMSVIADGDGSSSFVFALPVREGWAGTLASITLTGPGGSFTLDENSDRPMAILRNPETGQIRQIMRDLPPGPAGREAAERTGAETGFVVFFSRGIPDPADWER